VRRLAGGAVLDASVGVKWVVAETGHEQARAVLQHALHDELPMAMPDFMAVEVGNALWAKVRRHLLSTPPVRRAFDVLLLAELRAWDT
jgi:predicted nucleic acid-binding protein